MGLGRWVGISVLFLVLFLLKKNIINVFKNGSHGYFDGKGGRDRQEGNARIKDTDSSRSGGN